MRLREQSGKFLVHPGGLAGWREVTKAEYDRLLEEHRPAAAAAGCAAFTGFRPLHSEALAVHPLDARAAAEDSRAKGVPTDFDHQGRPVFTSRAHRKAYFKAYRYYDRNAGYGDAARQ